MAAETTPYDPLHPVYRRVFDPTKWANSDAVVANLQEIITIDTGADSPPVYVGTSGDPSWSLTINGHTFTGVKAPAGIAPGSGVDYPLVILDDVTKIEYRMFQAVVTGDPTYTVTCTSGGVGVYAQQTGVDGTATIHNQHTGSNQSYLSGMGRPGAMSAAISSGGDLGHAIRMASLRINADSVSPASRSDQTTQSDEMPMGARVFLDESFDVESGAVTTAINAEVSTSEGRDAARVILRTIQRYGMIALDGTTNGQNLYFEADETADWEPIMGAPNVSGTWNDVGRAVAAAMSPWTSNLLIDITQSGPTPETTPAHVETLTGGGTSTSSATVANVPQVTDGTFVLDVSTRNTGVGVSSVAGGALTWTLVADQISRRGQYRVRRYIATGTPDADDFTVTVTLGSTADTVNLALTALSGADNEATLVHTRSNTDGTATANGVLATSGVIGDDDDAPVLDPLAIGGPGIVVLSVVSRVGFTDGDNDPTYTTRSTSTQSSGGGQITMRRATRDAGLDFEFDDLVIYGTVSDTDWLMMATFFPTLVTAGVSTNNGRGRLISASPGPARIRGSRL